MIYSQRNRPKAGLQAWGCYRPDLAGGRPQPPVRGTFSSTHTRITGTGPALYFIPERRMSHARPDFEQRLSNWALADSYDTAVQCFREEADEEIKKLKGLIRGLEDYIRDN